MSDDKEFPIIRFVDHVLEYAVQRNASDVHFETFANSVLIRLRIDGVLVELPAPVRNLGDAIISRIKTIANLDLAEKRLPQDGHIERTCLGRSVDFRVSTLPTQYGESVVLRVLDRDSWHFDLEQMGLGPEILAQLRQILHSGSGIVLATGPTGSGKTTTLYSALNEINDEETKIVTVEDPVEYETEGMVQVNVRDDVGLTFESALRAFLRHDPDKILVGELRDALTARIAIQAALTGHLVLGTLHTNDAPSSITRLVDMEIDPYLIADTVKGIIAQRLLRKICPDCKMEATMTPEAMKIAGPHGVNKIFCGRGCENCNHTGYKGRFGIYEWLMIDFTIRDGIRKRLSLDKFHELAIQNGLTPLKQAALKALREGTTTVTEFGKI
ncbi:MAG: GspE/PulE family protein [Puniceicoccales bacterium]|jgi:type IV pilus assembly protein PilB|nr:GspE/PulE family protein [Puniceicoccales bacterium]